MTKNGFTLVEVLVALVIVTTVFMGCYFAISELSRSSSTLKQKTLASLIANKEIMSLALGPKQSIGGSKSLTMGDETFMSSVNLQLTNDKNIKVIEIAITNDRGITTLTQKRVLFVPNKP